MADPPTVEILDSAPRRLRHTELRLSDGSIDIFLAGAEAMLTRSSTCPRGHVTDDWEVVTSSVAPTGDPENGAVHLRLIRPQWQGAGSPSVHALAPEFAFEVARRGYAVGATVLEAVLPAHDGPTATVPVSMSDDGLEERDGVEAKSVVVKQLGGALEILRQYQPVRITTLGGECSVSVAPFSELANRYGDDLAVVWIDSHPDVGTPDSEYPGYHAMAVTALTGHGDPDVLGLLPATVSPDRVALVGLHSWTEDDYPNVAEWGIRAFSPDELRVSSETLLDWIFATVAHESQFISMSTR